MTQPANTFGADPAPWRHRLAERDDLMARLGDLDDNELERFGHLEFWLDDQLANGEAHYKQSVQLARALHPSSSTMREIAADERKRKRRIRIAVVLAVIAAVLLFAAGRASAHTANGVVTVQCGKGFTFEVRATGFAGAGEVEPWGALSGREWQPILPGETVTFFVVDGPGHYEGGATIHFADGVQSAATFKVDVPDTCGQPTTTSATTAAPTTTTGPRVTLGPAPTRPPLPEMNTTTTTVDLCKAVVYCPTSDDAGSSSPTRPTVPLAERPGPDTTPPSGSGRTLPATGAGHLVAAIGIGAVLVILGVGAVVIASCSPRGLRRQMAWIVAFQWWKAIAGRPVAWVSERIYRRIGIKDDETP